MASQGLTAGDADLPWLTEQQIKHQHRCPVDFEAVFLQANAWVSSATRPLCHGLPAASVVGLTTALGLLEGTSSTIFALALVVTLIVAYDATGVRLHAGG